MKDALENRENSCCLDRLLHQAHVCQTTGDSIRLIQALAGKGVMPLN